MPGASPFPQPCIWERVPERDGRMRHIEEGRLCLVHHCCSSEKVTPRGTSWQQRCPDCQSQGLCHEKGRLKLNPQTCQHKAVLQPAHLCKRCRKLYMRRSTAAPTCQC